MNDLKAIFKKNKEEALDDYFTFLRFSSISTDPSYKKDILDCANWLSNKIKNIGFETELWETSTNPIIFAKNMHAGPDKPTLLIYNHYDVQPVDPIEEWNAKPFEPTVINGNVYARGAQDNKGQCSYVIHALKALIEKYQTLPINIKLCIEGDEETGSAGLSEILPSKTKELKADYLAIVDLGPQEITKPALNIGIRGILTLEVELIGSNSDLHSGSHGGIVYNPIHALVEILSKLRDNEGKITVPGFYDDVVDTDSDNIDFSFDEDKYEQEFGAKPVGGEKAYSPLERAWIRPTLEINGITGGYTGPGFKTVIPAKASAKISCRLVPNQEPKKIGNLIAKFLKKNTPEGLQINVNVNPGGGIAVRSQTSSKIVQAFTQAYSEVFQTPCGYVLEGGSIPIVEELAAASNSEPIMMGMALPGDHIHAPNEHFGLDRFEMGFLIIARTIEILNPHFLRV